MANNGYISGGYSAGGSNGLGFNIYLRWEIQSQSFRANTSTIKYRLTGKRTRGIGDAGGAPWSITINGKTYTGTYSGSLTSSSEVEITNGTATITHTASGAKVFNLSFSYEKSSIIKASGSGTGTLNALPVAASITSTHDFNDESGVTLNYSNPSGDFLDSLDTCLSFDGVADHIPYRPVPKTIQSPATSLFYNYSFTDAERQTIWEHLGNSDTGTVRVYLRSGYKGEYLHKHIVVNVKLVNHEPVLTPVIYDTNPDTIALTGNKYNLIRYMSDVYYNMNVELRKGALDVIGCYIQNGGRIEEGFEEGTFNEPTSNVFYFSATDNRGVTSTYSKSYDVFWGEFINYIKPTVNLTCSNISGEGELEINITGKYFNAYFGETEKNSLSLQYAVYKKGTTPKWVNYGVIPVIMTDNTTYSYSLPVHDLDYTASYLVAVKVSDRLMTVDAEVTAVAMPVFYWNGEEFVFNVPVRFNAGYSEG